MKDAYYFPHDSNARLDVKMIKFRAKHGYEGYGIFWAIIEVLRDQAEWKLSVDDLDVLSLSIQVDTDKLKLIIDDLVDIKLLKRTANYIYSESLTRRMQYFEDRKNTYRNNGKKGGRPKANEKLNKTYSKPTGYDLLKQNESKTKAVKVSKESKGKEEAILSFFSDYSRWSEQGLTEKSIITGRNGSIGDTKIQKALIWDMCQHISTDITRANARWYFIRILDKSFVTHQGDDMTVRLLYEDIKSMYERGWLKTATDNDKPNGINV
jgi:hypothetical protein